MEQSSDDNKEEEVKEPKKKHRYSQQDSWFDTDFVGDERNEMKRAVNAVFDNPKNKHSPLSELR